MKYLFTTVFFFILHSVLTPDKLLSSNDNQLVTEIRIVDNDSTFRFLYMYDDLGNKVLETKYFQQDSTWIRETLNEWSYNGNKCIYQHESQWTNSGWMIFYTIDYTFNSDQLISETHNIYSNGIASLFKKIDYQYQLSLLNSKKEYSWQLNNWMLSIETDFNYSNGMTDSIHTTSYQNGTINDQLHSSFIYNQDGTLQTQILQEFVGNVWTNLELINWFYQPNSILIGSVINKSWNTDTSSWDNTQRIDYQYINNSQLVSETYLRWMSMFWENDMKYDYQYDSNNNLLKKTLSQPLYNDWRDMMSINYSNFTQNVANNIDSEFDFWGGDAGSLTTSYIPFMFNNIMTVQKGSSIQISYLPSDYTELVTPVENNSLQLIPVYPNPSEGIFYINTQKYIINSWTVSDLNGQVLKKQAQTFQSGVIDLTDLPKGVYLLRVIVPDGQMIQKLIKE